MGRKTPNTFFVHRPKEISEHQYQPKPPSNLTCNLASTFPSHPRPSKFPSTFSKRQTPSVFQAVCCTKCLRTFFWPMQRSGPRLELRLAIYNQRSKKSSRIVKVQKYFMPKGFGTCDSLDQFSKHTCVRSPACKLGGNIASTPRSKTHREIFQANFQIAFGPTTTQSMYMALPFLKEKMP